MGFVHLACEGQHLAFHTLDHRQLRKRAFVLVEHCQRAKRLLAVAGIAHAIAQRVAVRRRATDHRGYVAL